MRNNKSTYKIDKPGKKKEAGNKSSRRNEKQKLKDGNYGS
jgi:hypothetical protein